MEVKHAKLKRDLGTKEVFAVSAGAMIATAFLVPSIYSYKPELVWVVGFYTLPIMGWFLWDRVSV